MTTRVQRRDLLLHFPSEHSPSWAGSPVPISEDYVRRRMSLVGHVISKELTMSTGYRVRVYFLVTDVEWKDLSVGNGLGSVMLNTMNAWGRVENRMVSAHVLDGYLVGAWGEFEGFSVVGFEGRLWEPEKL